MEVPSLARSSAMLSALQLMYTSLDTCCRLSTAIIESLRLRDDPLKISTSRGWRPVHSEIDRPYRRTS